MKRIICFDIETTGFEYARGDKIVEVAGIELIDGKVTNNSFHAYVNPDGKTIGHDSYMVHKLSNDFLNDKPIFSEIAPKLLEFFGTSKIVAHNGIDFDFPFLNFELAKLRLPLIQKNKQLDTLSIARNRVYGPKSYSLDSLANWFGISLVARADAHGALIDAEILAKLYIELMNTEPVRDTKEIIQEQHEEFLKHPKIGQDFSKRNFEIPEAELLNHQEFMKKINA